jgi:hypothetical protein
VGGGRHHNTERPPLCRAQHHSVVAPKQTTCRHKNTSYWIASTAGRLGSACCATSTCMLWFCSNMGRVWKRGCGQPGPASRPWPDLGRLKRATHSCLGYWPNPAWARRDGVWAPLGSRAGSPTATCNTPCFCSVVICANDPLNTSSNYP